MSSIPTKQFGGDGISAATAAAKAYFDSIGLRSVLEHGVARLLETNPLPASALSAWLVLATDITRVIKAQGHGQANDAVASAMLAGFESLVREEERGWRQTGWWVYQPAEEGGCVCMSGYPGVRVVLTLSSRFSHAHPSPPRPPNQLSPSLQITGEHVPPIDSSTTTSVLAAENGGVGGGGPSSPSVDADGEQKEGASRGGVIYVHVDTLVRDARYPCVPPRTK